MDVGDKPVKVTGFPEVAIMRLPKPSLKSNPLDLTVNLPGIYVATIPSVGAMLSIVGAIVDGGVGALVLGGSVGIRKKNGNGVRVGALEGASVVVSATLSAF